MWPRLNSNGRITILLVGSAEVARAGAAGAESVPTQQSDVSNSSGSNKIHPRDSKLSCSKLESKRAIIAAHFSLRGGKLPRPIFSPGASRWYHQDRPCH